mgnify:CR=1 FL=1
MPKQLLKAIGGFLLLFILYHAAEYMIMFQNSPAGFLFFQVAFFLAAWLIVRWQARQGMSAWGLDVRHPFIKHLLSGISMGILLYGLTYLISLFVGSERFIGTPSFKEAIPPLLLFIFGSFFSSLSEDILTRGYVFYHLKERVGGWVLVIISALIYLLNHIYRLDDGPQAWLYLFSLGVLFAIPLLLTKRLWFTGGLHWAGNCVFFLTHEIFTTQTNAQSIDANYILVLCILIIIPVNYVIIRALKLNDLNQRHQLTITRFNNEGQQPIELS